MVYAPLRTTESLRTDFGRAPTQFQKELAEMWVAPDGSKVTAGGSGRMV